MAEGNGPTLACLRDAGVSMRTLERLLRAIREVEMERDAMARQDVVHGLRTFCLFDKAVEQVAVALTRRPQLGSLSPPRGGSTSDMEASEALT